MSALKWCVYKINTFIPADKTNPPSHFYIVISSETYDDKNNILLNLIPISTMKRGLETDVLIKKSQLLCLQYDSYAWTDFLVTVPVNHLINKCGYIRDAGLQKEIISSVVS